MKRVMILVLPTDWSPKKTSLYLARGETVAIYERNGSVSFLSLCFNEIFQIWMNEWISEKSVMKKKKTERKRRKKWTTKYTPFSTSSFLYIRLKTAKCQPRWEMRSTASSCQLSYFLFYPSSFFNSSFTPLPSKLTLSKFIILSCKIIIFFIDRQNVYYFVM